jgi:hypothetical protein
LAPYSLCIINKPLIIDVDSAVEYLHCEVGRAANISEECTGSIFRVYVRMEAVFSSETSATQPTPTQHNDPRAESTSRMNHREKPKIIN